jgi:hypothetical protein
MYYTIDQLKHAVFKQVYDVYDVFINYFGEDFVDLQGLPNDLYILPNDCCIEELPNFDISDEMLQGLTHSQHNVKPFILVYWPRVTVTNEYNKSIDIQDLYAKIELDYLGRIPTENRGFLLNRATYNVEQWTCDYMHSHIPGIPKSNLESFQLPCLGTGPIIQTISELKANIADSFDEIKWMLFCEELSRYVHVESIHGVPYRNLENVSIAHLSDSYKNYKYPRLPKFVIDRWKRAFRNDMDTLKDFIRFYLHHGHLTINYKNDNFIVGMSYYEYIIDISNAFISWCNNYISNREYYVNVNTLILHDIITKVIISSGKIYSTSCRIPSIDSYSSYIGRKVCDFKGREITLNITQQSDFVPQETTLLDNELASFILYNVLRTINYHYDNKYTEQHTSGELTSTSKRVQYV